MTNASTTSSPVFEHGTGAGTSPRTAPGISVFMPILDEEKHLAEAVGAILAQRYDGPVEIVLAIGPCTDGTWEVARALAAQDERITLVHNPTGRTPDGLNAALAATHHDILVRVDGHGILSPGYLQTVAQVLAETGAANVGGIMDAEGTTAFEQAVECAMKSKIGVGGVKFKQGGAAGAVETVYLGNFAREWIEKVGMYDPRYTRAQDWELNFRIRKAGGTVWFTPGLRVTYRPRPNIRALAKQYFEYGTWRRVVARQHRGSINLRYLAPPVAVVGVMAGTLLGTRWRPALAAPLGYLALVTAGGVRAARGRSPQVVVRMPLVLTAMHLSWGLGFLTSRVELEPDLAGDDRVSTQRTGERPPQQRA